MRIRPTFIFFLLSALVGIVGYYSYEMLAVSREPLAASCELLAKSHEPLAVGSDQLGIMRLGAVGGVRRVVHNPFFGAVKDDEGKAVEGSFLGGGVFEEGEMELSLKIEEALALERLRTQDLSLGYVPYERKALAIEQTLKRQRAYLRTPNGGESGSSLKLRWVSKGPFNTGGRTRAILIDMNDATRKTLFVGGADGGIWKTSDVTQSNPNWQIVNDWMGSLAIGALGQDPIHPNIMYAGTGDGDGNAATGVGIFRSMDGGKTWGLLPSTVGGAFGTSMAFLITPDSGYVYAATFGGLYKSTDRGDSWYEVLGSGSGVGFASDRMYGIQRGADGTLYAATANSVYKSTRNGEAKTWVNLVNTTGFPTGLVRIEIGVAPTSSNIVYLVGQQSNKGSAVYRTRDGGFTWQNMGKVTWQDGCSGPNTLTDFTRGQAFYDLVLAVSPLDTNLVYLGGVDLFRSIDGGGCRSFCS